MTVCTIPVSVGELADKITILQIKSERIADPAKLTNVRSELNALRSTWDALPFALQPEVGTLVAALKAVNEQLWDIEDEIRVCEAAARFDDRFVDLARSVYKTNDWRAALKRRLNELTGSVRVEEKHYVHYEETERVPIG
jgi:vacuolar-type H+-ATPase subunit I/STV1